ncbi:structural maintenance of chromosomes protein 4 [Anthonomus grandis grandis]|uniref:structural maintenance of chromosomes protein 4 n=1 Tax=Anthonomus grandis grandis TaxID=2921223 RepID=UPI0021661A6F|nr:structural maintenance of chromosomes protein 4 [Anthonomus grandis grandis]
MLPTTLVLLGLLCFWGAEIEGTVTTEDIRQAILQMVNVARNTDDKLERHEFREKQLGEQLKKGLINIDKRIKMLDPLKGAVSRLDERLATVETILMQKEKEDRDRQVQQQQIYDIVLDIQKKLPALLDQLNADITEKVYMTIPPAEISEPMMTKKDFTEMENKVVKQMENVSTTVRKLESELTKIRTESMNSISDLNNKSSQSLEIVKRQLDSNEHLLEKYENKLAEYNNRIPEIPVINYKEQDEWKDHLLKALEVQKTQVNEVVTNVRLVQSRINDLPQKTDVELTQNLTMEKLEEIKEKIPKGHLGPLENLEGALKEVRAEAAKNHDVVKASVNELTDITSHLTEQFSSNYENIRTEIQNIAKLEHVIIQTGDSVMDTKRRVEYGVHQILSELEKQMKAGSLEINQGINERFEAFELSILDEEYGALHNLTSKIQEEIGRVWRQIGIMHQQMSASTDTLNKLQNQTDVYVSGSVDVMDSMKGKVTQITGKIEELDGNLNFLVGKLSLVSQEFNRIKSGLGSTLDEIRSSFQKVQEGIKKDRGPGPHKISSNEILDVPPSR